MKHIEYGFAETPFGEIIAARSEIGICDVQFLTHNRAAVISELGARWGVYTPISRNDGVARLCAEVFFNHASRPYVLDYRGTDFQKSVWRAVRMVPLGETVSYSELARRIDKPLAVRAVASAVASNPIALLVPCHRVIPADGSTGDYHWGARLKRDLLLWEREEAMRCMREE